MKKSVTFALCLYASVHFDTPLWASLSSITAAEEVDAINKIAPVYQHSSSEPIRILAVEPSSSIDLDGGAFGTFATTSPVFFDLDSSNNLRAATCLGGKWRTFMAATLTSSWSATTTLPLVESVQDGTASPSSPYTLNLLLTKTGATAANLLLTGLYATLQKVRTTNLTASSSGTVLASSKTMPTGWNLKAFMADATSTPTLAVLDPLSSSLTVNVTTTSGTVMPFTAGLSNLHNWNVATNDTSKIDILFTATGRSIKMSVTPGLLSRATGIADSVVSALSTMPLRIHQTSTQVGYKNTLPLAVSQALSAMDTTAPTSIMDGIKSIAACAVSGASFTVGDAVTTVDTNKLALIFNGNADLTSVSWSVDSTRIKATATLGSTESEIYTCDLSGIETITDVVANVQTFTAPSGKSFVLRCYDSTGYDTSSDTTVDPSERDALLAMIIKGKLAGTTTIAYSALKQTVISALS